MKTCVPRSVFHIFRDNQAAKCKTVEASSFTTYEQEDKGCDGGKTLIHLFNLFICFSSSVKI